MEFLQYLKVSNDSELLGISETLALRFSELTTRGHSVADLVAHYSEDFGHIPPERLRSLANCHRSWQIWRRGKQQIEEARCKAQLPPIHQEVWLTATRPDQLEAIVRTARLGGSSTNHDTEKYRNVLSAGVELWSRCLSIAKKEGKVRSQAKDLQHPEAAAFDPYVRLVEDLKDIAPHRWLAMRRGEKVGVLILSLDYPREKLFDEITNFLPRLGEAVAQRTTESLLEELILNDLQPWLFRLIDREAQQQAISAASENFAGLLRTPPLQTKALGAVYYLKARAPLAAVVINHEGDLENQRLIKPEGPWIESLLAFFHEKELEQVVLPTSSSGMDILNQIEAKLDVAGIQVIKVRSAALSEARQVLVDPPHRLSTSIASAIVLGRRAIDPLKEWSAVDPVNIGIAEYQNDLDVDALRATLQETAELCRLERRRGKRLSIGGGAAPKGNTAMARLNPLVKSVNDLRSGMMVHGLVTNISHFGAFINIGLPQEALIHVSEISDRFITNPNEVVNIGQQVTAQVISVDASRGRISLSLKTKSPSVPSAIREERRPIKEVVNRYPTKALTPSSKAQALANLEKLFKK